MLKQLWRGIFNFHNVLVKEYAYAYTQDQARIVMARRIAKKQGVLPVVVLSWLKEHPQTYKIQLEIEFIEEVMGLAKAKAVDENIDRIRMFVDKHSKG